MEKINKGYIYLITCTKNAKYYVGQTRKFKNNGVKIGIIGRWKQHLYNAINFWDDCPKLNRAIRKYGEDYFVVEKILSCSMDELNHYEEQYIEEFNSCDEGYNCTLGGDYPQFSAEQRKKMNDSISKKAKIRWSDPNYRKNISDKIRKTAAINAQKTKMGDNLPTNIFVIRNKNKILKGYGVKIVINGVAIRKNFSSSEFSLDENLEEAKKHLNKIKKKYFR